MSDFVVKEGYLHKQSKYLKVFRKRWIILKGKYLYSYKNKHIIQNHTEKIDLTLVKHISQNNKTIKFEIILSPNTTYQFIASSIHNMNDWIKNIKHTINKYSHSTTNTNDKEGENNITSITKPDKNCLHNFHKINVSSNSNIHITAYWEGYTEQGCAFPLNQISEKVNTIPIAFIQPIKDPKSSSTLATTWAFDDQFVYSKEDIKQWIAEINNRVTNQRVLLSLLDTPTCHWYPDVDIDLFAQNIAKDVDEWGIGGVDVDAESGMQSPQTQYVKTFVLLIKSLRKYLSADKIISYTCYTESQFDGDIITQCRADIDYINTMAYWGGKDAQIALYQHYVNDIGDVDKVGIGVKAGNGGDSTSLDTVKQCAEWFRDNDDIHVKRMMLWSLTRDVKDITAVDDGVYLDTIYENICQDKGKIIRQIMQYIESDSQKNNVFVGNENKINIIQNITINIL